jgi:hypothetical protein
VSQLARKQYTTDHTMEQGFRIRFCSHECTVYKVPQNRKAEKNRLQYEVSGSLHSWMMPNCWYKCMITINVPVGFYGAVRNDLEAGNIHYEGHFGPKWHSLRSLPFQGPKKSRFQGPPLIMAQVMDIARLKIIKSNLHRHQ